jgi:hypothetical protein
MMVIAFWDISPIAPKYTDVLEARTASIIRAMKRQSTSTRLLNVVT